MKTVKMGVRRLFNHERLEKWWGKMFYEQCWFSLWQGGGFGGHCIAYGGQATFFQGNVIYAKCRHICKWALSKTAHIACSMAIKG